MKKLTDFLGKKTTTDYDDFYGSEVDDIYGDNEESDDDVTTYNDDKGGVSFSAPSAPVSLKVVKPKSHADGRAIADHLSAGSTVVLNIESLDRASSMRLIDFLMGAVHVLGGDMKVVTKTTLVFAPRNVGVSDFEHIEENEDVEEIEEYEE